ncbi:Iron ABC transporter permease [Bacillus manliponensis]
MQKEEVVKWTEYIGYFTVAIVCIGIFDAITNLLV